MEELGTTDHTHISLLHPSCHVCAQSLRLLWNDIIILWVWITNHSNSCCCPSDVILNATVWPQICFISSNFGLFCPLLLLISTNNLCICSNEANLHHLPQWVFQLYRSRKSCSNISFVASSHLWSTWHFSHPISLTRSTLIHTSCFSKLFTLLSMSSVQKYKHELKQEMQKVFDTFGFDSHKFYCVPDLYVPLTLLTLSPWCFTHFPFELVHYCFPFIATYTWSLYHIWCYYWNASPLPRYTIVLNNIFLKLWVSKSWDVNSLPILLQFHLLFKRKP